jgi:hypothetical protein
MEGSYAKLFEARLQAPADSDLYFMDILQTTARNEIASCIEKAYLSLHLDDATKLIRLSSREETVKFAQQVRGSRPSVHIAMSLFLFPPLPPPLFFLNGNSGTGP